MHILARQADPEFGRMQAKELHNHLTEVLRDYAVEVSTKPGKLQVGPRGVDKGSLLRQALQTVITAGDCSSRTQRRVPPSARRLRSRGGCPWLP